MIWLRRSRAASELTEDGGWVGCAAGQEALQEKRDRLDL